VVIRISRHQKPLSQQKGNLTKEQQVRKQLIEDMVKVDADQLEKKPTWLRNSVAKNEWDRLLIELKKLEFIGNLDYNNLGAYCNAFAMYVQATKELKKVDLTFEYLAANGVKQIKSHPLIDVQRKYLDEMRRFSTTLGLTIDSRLKMAGGTLGKKEETIKDTFGDI